MIEYIFYVLIIVLGIPTGLVLAYLCHEELRAWRKRMMIITGVSLVLCLAILFSGFEYSWPAITGLLFIATTFLTVYFKSLRHKHVESEVVKKKKVKPRKKK